MRLSAFMIFHSDSGKAGFVADPTPEDGRLVPDIAWGVFRIFGMGGWRSVGRNL